MGLIVFALVTVLLLVLRRSWARLRGNPLPVVTARPGRTGLRRFLDGLGKAKPSPRTPRPCQQAVPRAVLSTVDCEVLVVGAGPSGLMAAALLVRQGVRVRVIDANPGPATESRAFAVQASTIELFRNLGLAEELAQRGVVTTGIRFHIRGREAGGLDFDRSRAASTPYQHILMAPQAEVEELLLHDLARHDVVVERGTRLESLVQRDSEVAARLIRDRQPGSALTCHFLIGADGAHSAVRKQLGLAFEGEKYAQRYLLADCRVDWPFDHSHFRVFMNRERIGLFLPLHGASVSRVMTTDLSTEDSGPLDLAHLQAELRAATGVEVTLSDPVWTSRYQAHLRQVQDYRLGRCFLVGDAAHIHSPAGGQGLNTGLQDAANLCWKLAAVLRTGADPALLDSYTAERHPAGVQVLEFSDRLHRFAAGLRGWRARLRDRLGPFLIARMSAAPLPHRKSFGKISQLNLAYPASQYNVNELLYSLKGPLAGTRAPDARINPDRQLFDLVQGYQLHVLAFSRAHLGEAEIAEHSEQLRGIAEVGGVRTHLIGRVAGRRDERVTQADSVQVFEHYGLTEPDSQALYVIRPDGHVAWRCDALDYEACRHFLRQLHGGIAPCQDFQQDQAA